MAFRGRGGAGVGARGGLQSGGSTGSLQSAGASEAPKIAGVEWLADTITCHAWNADRTKLAVCPNNTEVRIYAKDGSGDWIQEDSLNEHDKIVTGIDWAPKTNRIVTCGQDRNAYVWTFTNGVWKPVLVILRINRAATHVKWSPLEDKFAVASGSKAVSVCYFEEQNDWWVSKHIKRHESTVTDIAWHPNNILLASSSSDNTVKVVSAFIRETDKRPGPTAFGSKLPFGAQLGEYLSAGWVHAVDWSPSGNRMVFVGHDSTVTFVDVTNGAPGDVQAIRVSELPFMSVRFVDENNAVAAGHSNYPVLFSNNGGTWAYVRNLDEQKAAGATKAAGARAAFQMFQSKVETGQESKTAEAITKHKSTISCVQPVSANQVTTTGLDGRLVFWSL
jgi:actin related protein 2/3 complex, subunit 1A/1B